MNYVNMIILLEVGPNIQIGLLSFRSRGKHVLMTTAHSFTAAVDSFGPQRMIPSGLLDRMTVHARPPSGHSFNLYGSIISS